ncbi:HNH/ENDO VII family nuclease [Cerasibacillus terrae]
MKYPQVIHSSILSQNTPSPKNNKVSDKQFNNFRRKYWKWRSNNLE